MANKKVSQLTSKPSVLTTDLFPIADPSTGQLYKTTISDLGTAIGSGVSSVNGLVGAVVLDTDDIQELVSPTNKWFTDTRARAALSASSPLAYNSGTGVFSIPAATSSQNGYLTSTDWSTFNSKQAALSGTGFVKISGTTISYDNTAYLPLAGGTLTGALFGASASFSGFVGFGGNTSPLAAIDVTGAGIFSSSVRSSGYYLTGMTSGSGALYYSSGSNRVTVANYNASGIIDFEVNGGASALTLNANLSATFKAGASFAGALSGTSATFSGAIAGRAGGYLALYDISTNTNRWDIYTNSDNSFRMNYNGSGGDEFTIASTGAATFSSSVTQSASDSRLLGGDSVGRYIISNSDTSAYTAIYGSSHATSANQISLITNSQITFNSGSGYAERMRITSGGAVLIGTTSDIAGAVSMRTNISASNFTLGLITDSGASQQPLRFVNGSTAVGSVTTSTSTTSYNVVSDYRLKEDLKSINGLEIVNRIKVYDYKWKVSDSRMDGVMAHELQEVLPYAVTGVKDGEEMQSVDYSKIVPVMVQAIKDLKAELDTLKNK